MNTDLTQAEIRKLLTTTAPAFSDAAAVQIAARHYGMRGQVRSLASDRDQNFRLDADDGKRYTLKIANRTDQQKAIDFQNRAMLHIADRDASIPLPGIIPASDGDLHCVVEGNSGTHIVRMLSWLEGTVSETAISDAGLLHRLGRLLARLDLALEDFEHPASNPLQLWDMKRASNLQGLLVHVEDPALQKLISQTLDRFISEVKPTFDTLRTQVIYNDLNLGNVLLDEKQPDQISGIIDFGDLVRSPLIIDLAIAAAYQLSDGDDPLAGVLPLIAGYHAINPLQSMEMDLLTDLIRTRLITSLLINTYRSKLFPENREYLLISYHSAKNFLINLERHNTDHARERIHLACSSG